MQLEDLIYNLVEQSEENLTQEELKKEKRAYSKANNLGNLPTNIQLLKTYSKMIEEGKISQIFAIENILRKRGVRSMSGIVPIQVLTKPFWCPGECIFCPNDDTMPKSYIKSEPGAMRALLNDFDPYKQAYNRLLSLSITGHPTDKIEMIVLGGTWDVYPDSYKEWFIKGLFDACNTFDQFREQIDIDYENPKSARFTVNENLNIDYSESVEEAQSINENANHRIIGLTVETRPEYVTDKNCQFWRRLGVTRIEMGIQCLFDDVLEANKRGHNTDQIREAMHKLRQYGFKISNHFMPGLYKSTLQKDIETIKIAYEDKYIKPDEIKFYPTSVIPNTELYNLYKSGEYTPLENEDIKKIIREIKINYIPPYTRIKRLIRDIPATEIAAGSNITNLRQLTLKEIENDFKNEQELKEQQYKRLYPNLKNIESIDEILNFNKNNEVDTFILNSNVDYSSKRKFICLCTRCREVKNKIDDNEDKFMIFRKYFSSVGEECFISVEDKLGYLYGFTRLLLPFEFQALDIEGLGKNTSIIRELHVYGKVARINSFDTDEEQHKGVGTKLMEASEKLSRLKGYNKLSVISGIGVRGYYRKLGYELEGTYMVKKIK